MGSVQESICRSAVKVAQHVKAKALICITHTGGTALQIARYRPNFPILAMTPNLSTVRKLKLAWGIDSILLEDFDFFEPDFEFITKTFRRREHISFEEGDLVVITAGLPDFGKHTTNCVKVHSMVKN